MATISGRVIDYDNDNPISGVTVTGVSQNGTAFASTTTSSTGNFSITDQNFDNLYSRVSFTKEGYTEQNMQPSSANGADVVLAKSGMQAFTLVLKQNKNKIFIALFVIALIFIIVKYYKPNILQK